MNIILFEQQILITTKKSYELPDDATIKQLSDLIDVVYNDNNYIVATVSEATYNSYNANNTKFVPLKQALPQLNATDAEKIVFYKQLTHYYLTHKFCGSCGHETTKQSHTHFLFCPNCQTEIYPHIAPSIIVRIHKHDQILMARGINFPQGIWGLIAGFVELGETLEQAVIRETKEEVGIDINNIQYFDSQAWPFPGNSLMVGFTADYVSGTITPQAEEIAEAAFFDKHNLPGYPSSKLSIAQKMIQDFITK